MEENSGSAKYSIWRDFLVVSGNLRVDIALGGVSVSDVGASSVVHVITESSKLLLLLARKGMS
jgi:hypothetical protein